VKWACALLVALIGGAFALDRAFPPDLARLQITGAEVLDRDGRTLTVLPVPGGAWRLRTTTSDVPTELTDLLIAAEDRRFRSHPGVDPIALLRASFQWVRAGRVVSGGSTLTMQAARLLEPRPRNLRSKLIEIFRAMQLEARFSKDEILGIWLTLAPQGGNIEGLRAGSLAWFGRPPAQLDAAQSALLIALAPHLSRQMAQPATTVTLTIDGALQRATERLAWDTLDTLPERTAIAIVIADIETRDIRALVGGAWGEESRAGMLDLTRAVRSPGSALKPFLYAMAFERGIATPSAIVADLPRRFGAYAPENFSRDFAGRVTAADALRMSLNLPAVALLDQVGALRFASALKLAGAAPRLPRGADASLPLALGGAGTTLREMVALYATLADGGQSRPLRLTPGPVEEPQQAVERRAAEAVAGILVQNFPGGGRTGVAWKTGTSWGGRDVWAMGFDARHVAGVWIGRPDGTAMPGATGRQGALPVLSRIFALLPEAPRERLRVVADAPRRQAPADRLRLLFPPPGAALTEGAGPVTLRAAGGRRPLAFLVDGMPIEHEAARREVAWTPPGPGFYRVTVLDAEGAASSAQVRVRAADVPPPDTVVLTPISATP